MRSFRIATYNIHKGRSMDWRVRIGRILRVLREVNADIIALQEVVNLPERSPEEHQASYLAEQLGFFYSVGETGKFRGAGYGNVTLSRWRFEAVRHIDLSVAGREPRGALRTDIRLDQEVLHVFNVHLGTGVGERDEQARLIDERLLKSLDVPGHRIVMGDFNEWKHGMVTKTLTREFHLNDLSEHLPRIRGYPALMPLLHIDHIYVAAQQGHPVVLRMTAVRARSMAGGMLRDGMDQRVVWKPSRDDRKSHRELPAHACVEGRLIVRQVQPSNGTESFLLALFSTLPDAPAEVVKMYGYRWNIELDLRILKGTLRLDDLTCNTPEMVAKEINLAMLSYNLTRAVMYWTARKAGLECRAFSFTRVRNVLNTFLPVIAAATDERQAQKAMEDMRYYLNQAQLPNRKGKRSSYPRKVWARPKSYPAQHA